MSIADGSSASPVIALIEKIASNAPAFPRFPEAFGPRDRSNIQRFTGRLKNPDLEASRVIVRNKIRAARNGGAK